MPQAAVWQSGGAGRIESSASSVAGRPLACGRLPARSRPACRQRRTGVRQIPTPDDCPGSRSRAWAPCPTTEAPTPPSDSRVRSCLPGWHRLRRRNRAPTAEGTSCETRPAAASGSRAQWPGAQRLACNLLKTLIPGGGGPPGLGRVPIGVPIGRTSACLERRTRPTNVTLRCVYDMCTTHGTAIRLGIPGGSEQPARRIPRHWGVRASTKRVRAENDRKGFSPQGRRSPGPLPPAHGPDVERAVIQRVRVVSAITRPSSGQRVA